MKHLYSLTLVFALTVAACTKSNNVQSLPEDKGCIDRIVIPVTAHSISIGDIAIVNNLFLSNGIDNTKYRYYQYIHDTLQTLYSPYTKYDEKTVRVDQYANGVRIFTDDLAFIFFDDAFHYMGGHKTNGTNLDVMPNLTLGQLRKLFIDDIEEFDHKGNQYKDSCFKAEFGYFNLDPVTSDTTET